MQFTGEIATIQLQSCPEEASSLEECTFVDSNTDCKQQGVLQVECNNDIETCLDVLDWTEYSRGKTCGDLVEQGICRDGINYATIDFFYCNI